MRIISLSPNITEIIFALGAGDELVGVTTFCNFPPEAAKITKVGGVLDPNYETMVSLTPDVVIVLKSQQQRTVELQELGLKTFVVANETLQDVFESITSIGELLGRQKEAASLRADMESCMNAIRDKVAALEKRRVAFVFEHSRGTLQDIYVAGKGNFINELLDMAGGYNVFADVGIGYPQINLEAFIERKPEVIFDATQDGGDPYTVFKDLESMRGLRIYFCYNDFNQVPGPRLVDSLDYLVRRLHPEAFKD
jgi:iron complex transport system substrate-binding protein